MNITVHFSIQVFDAVNQIKFLDFKKVNRSNAKIYKHNIVIILRKLGELFCPIPMNKYIVIDVAAS